jgi:hypothetical protein
MLSKVQLFHDIYVLILQKNSYYFSKLVVMKILLACYQHIFLVKKLT